VVCDLQRNCWLCDCEGAANPRHGYEREDCCEEGGEGARCIDKKKRKRLETYSIYIYKVLKQVHPDTGISSKAMSIMNSFVFFRSLPLAVLIIYVCGIWGRSSRTGSTGPWCTSAQAAIATSLTKKTSSPSSSRVGTARLSCSQMLSTSRWDRRKIECSSRDSTPSATSSATAAVPSWAGNMRWPMRRGRSTRREGTSSRRRRWRSLRKVITTTSWRKWSSNPHSTLSAAGD